MYFDSHAHLTNLETFVHIDEIIKHAQEAHVLRIANICTDFDSLQKGVDLQKKYPWIVNTAATTPHDVEKEGEEFFPIVEKYAKEKKLAAIGETGLDYFYEHSPRKLQQEFLCRYFSLAEKLKLPVVIHCREAFSDLFKLADECGFTQPTVLHCFTGTVEEAKRVVDRGWYLSLSGIVTFKKSEALREVASYVPLHQLLIETDTPYLAPQSKRGKANEPAFIEETAKVIADTKKIPLSTLAEATFKNACKFFSLEKHPPVV